LLRNFLEPASCFTLWVDKRTSNKEQVIRLLQRSHRNELVGEGSDACV